MSSKQAPPFAPSSATQQKEAPGRAAAEAPKPGAQKSMLEKLKLFNSKGASKSGGAAQSDAAGVAKQPGAAAAERAEAGSNTDPLEEDDDGNLRPGTNGSSPGAAYAAAPSASAALSTTASSPKMALRGIAQRTFSRALTAKKASVKGSEKDKVKDKVKEAAKRLSELRGEEPKEDLAPAAVDTDSSNRRTSKITSFIPKGGKVPKKDNPTPAHSGIPKPGGKAKAASAKEAAERPRSVRLAGGLSTQRGALDRDRDSRHSSSTSSLASAEGKSGAAPVVGGGTTQSTASNTISVQLPQNQQHHGHPNMATVAPFMYR